jgi:GntR family transcriptional regulator/MocR family aminotransferase
LALLHGMAHSGGFIIEDDFDAEFRFEGRPLASLFSLDRDDQVLYAGTFSRTMFPGLRLGYLVVPNAMIGAARAIKNACDSGEGTPLQVALASFIADGHYGAHLRRRKIILAAARKKLCASLGQTLGDLLTIKAGDGGLTLTALFHRPIDDRSVVAALAAVGLMARPLSAFYRGTDKKFGLVLGFAGWSDQQLADAALRLERMLRDAL